MNKLLIFLLQKALFSFHLMSLYAIWDNLFSFLVKVNQNLKFLHYQGFNSHWEPSCLSPARIVIAVFINSQQPL